MWFVSNLKAEGGAGEMSQEVSRRRDAKKKKKRVVKEFLTGGERAVALEPRPGGVSVPVGFPVCSQHRLSHSCNVYFC